MSRHLVDPYIGGLTRKVWQWVRGEIHAAAVAAGYDDLSPAQLSVFRNPSPQDMRPSDIAEDMQITKQSVNELLGHLERQGYLVRSPDPHDSRSRRVHLTDRGRELEKVVRTASAQAESEAATLIGPDRMQQLRSALAQLVGLLDDQKSGRAERHGR